jgi:hypothetical protein
MLGCLNLLNQNFWNDAATYTASYAGLTRVSITLRKNLSKKMDCRIKPGNDGDGLRLREHNIEICGQR